MRRIAHISFVLFLLGSLVQAQYRNIPDVVTKVATAANNWLKIESCVRAVGMGGAYVAAGEGISAVPYNPAAIGFIKGSEGYYSKTNYLVGISHNVMSYGIQLSGSDFFGLHLFYVNSGLMDVTTEAYPNGTGEEFSVTSLAFRTVYARRLTDRLKIGMSLDYIRDQIYTVRMQTLAFDIGSHFDTGIYGFELGMSVSNFGPEVQYHGEGLNQQVPDTTSVDGQLAKVTEHFPLPLVFRLGVKNDVIGKESTFLKSEDHRLSLALDGVNPSDYTVYGTMGCEYGFREMAFVRFGLHTGHDTASESFGAGVKIRIPRMVIGVDYAVSSYSELKLTHQVGINLEF